MLYLLGQSICIQHLEGFCKEDLSLFTDRFHHLPISVWTHVYLFYPLGYNPIDVIYVVA